MPPRSADPGLFYLAGVLVALVAAALVAKLLFPTHRRRPQCEGSKPRSRPF